MNFISFMFQKYQGLTRYLNTVSFFDEWHLVPHGIFADRQEHSLLIICFDRSNKSCTHIIIGKVDESTSWKLQLDKSNRSSVWIVRRLYMLLYIIDTYPYGYRICPYAPTRIVGNFFNVKSGATFCFVDRNTQFCA